MSDTADLTQAQVGDILHLRCGGNPLVVTHIKDVFVYSDMLLWRNNGCFYRDKETPFDVIRLEKKPKPRTIERWIVWTQNGYVLGTHDSVDDAEEAATNMGNPFAITHHIIKEGEGLDD